MVYKDAIKKLLLGGIMYTKNFVLGTVLLWSLAALGDSAIFGPDAEVFLFYKSGGEFVARGCEDYTHLEEEAGGAAVWRAACVGGQGEVLRVPVSAVRDAFRLLLRVPGGYDARTQEAIALYNGEDVSSERRQRLLAEKAELGAGLGAAEVFLREYEGAADPREVDRWKEALSVVSVRLDTFDGVGGEIEEGVDALVAEISDPARLGKYVFPRDAGSLGFGLLRAFVKSPVLPSSFRRIGAGSFRYEKRRDGDEDRPGDDVVISRAFALSAKETTQLQYFFVTGENPSRFQTEDDCADHMRVPTDDGAEVGVCPNNPVERVSWEDIDGKFLPALNALYGAGGSDDRNIFSRLLLNALYGVGGCDGKPSSPRGCFRLPTEAEWEYAARGGGRFMGRYPFDVGDLGRFAVFSADGTQPVGSKEPEGPYALFDIRGNVYEWVYDWWRDSPPSGTDPTVSRFGFDRVIRGGSWGSSARNLRSAYRNGAMPDSRFGGVGFRLVVAL